MIPAFTAFHSWLDTRNAIVMSNTALERRREKLWLCLQPALKKTPALSHLAGQPLDEFPVITPDMIRRDLQNWNSLGIEDAAAHAAAQRAETGERSEVLPGVIAGYSTGTSGNRGLFLASPKERAIYLGQSIAKLLPLSTLHSGIRIMLFLRADSRLYSNGRRSGLFQFMYCPLSSTLKEKQDAIRAFKPTILIAPSHVLMELADIKCDIPSLVKCYYGAEPIGDIERQWITEKIGIRPDPIYQATEGFLGASCPYGRLHLNEDSLHVELLPVQNTNGYQMIVTDLFRQSQPMIRIKLDDFIELDPCPCACGFAGRSILPVSGRVQNLWTLKDRTITPRDITNSIERVLGAGKKWSVTGSPGAIKLFLDEMPPPDFARHIEQTLYNELHLDCAIHFARLDPAEFFPKRQRVKWSNSDV